MFGETPSRKLDAFVEATGTGPSLSTTKELVRPQPKLCDEECNEEMKDAREDGGVPTINANFSF